MIFELTVAVAIIAFDGRFLNGSIHVFNLTIRPGMFDFGQPMIDAVLAAAHAEHMRYVSCRRATRVAARESKLDTLVGENPSDRVRIQDTASSCRS